jgi:small subunit ribosomal protein S18
VVAISSSGGIIYLSILNFGVLIVMKKNNNTRERRERTEKFQTFSRPKVKVIRLSESGKIYVDYKDTETLKRMMTSHGKILSRKRSGVSAMEQRMVSTAVKRARFIGLLPYIYASA